jgi:recombination protein RecA
MASDGRSKALESTLANLTKRFGEGAIMRLGEATHLAVEVIPTGSLALDLALGVGGVPRGRVTEIYGPEASGKTTLGQHIVAEAQKTGGLAAFIDMEHALDPTYAARCGVDVDNLYIAQPDTGEQALEIAEALVHSGAMDVVVIDSVAALVPRAEIEGEMGDAHMGLQARLMSQALRKLSGAIKQSNTAMIFTNQLRMKIGVMFGNPETTSGGRALKFYASVRLDVRRIQSIKDKGEVVGNRTRVRVTKNKVAPPFRQAEFDIMYNEGISRVGDILDIGVEMGVIDKRGSFYNYNDERLAQGRENAKAFLRENPEIAYEIESKIRTEFGLVPLSESAVSDNGRLEQEEAMEEEVEVEEEAEAIAEPAE